MAKKVMTLCLIARAAVLGVYKTIPVRRRKKRHV